jgi:hypothetical protein
MRIADRECLVLLATCRCQCRHDARGTSLPFTFISAETFLDLKFQLTANRASFTKRTKQWNKLRNASEDGQAWPKHVIKTRKMNGIWQCASNQCLHKFRQWDWHKSVKDGVERIVMLHDAPYPTRFKEVDAKTANMQMCVGIPSTSQPRAGLNYVITRTWCFAEAWHACVQVGDPNPTLVQVFLPLDAGPRLP